MIFCKKVLTSQLPLCYIRKATGSKGFFFYALKIYEYKVGGTG